MPIDRHSRTNENQQNEDYRRRSDQRAERRQKQRRQRLLLIGAFVGFAALFTFFIVMLVREVGNSEGKTSKSKDPASGSSSLSASLSDAQPTMPVAVDPTVWNLMLINGQREMPAGFTVETEVVSNQGHTFDKRAAEPLKNMIAACNSVDGHSLAVASALRGPQTQNGKYDTLVEHYKSQGETQENAEALARESEPPYGFSDHQTGLAVDFITDKVPQPVQAFADTSEFSWLMEHAHEYGFILRFPAEKAAITGITYQPYHFRYIGEEDAKAIRESGICLEEYLRELPTDSAPPAGSDAGSSSAAENGSGEGDSSGGDSSDDSSASK